MTGVTHKTHTQDCLVDVYKAAAAGVVVMLFSFCFGKKERNSMCHQKRKKAFMEKTISVSTFRKSADLNFWGT